MICKKLSGEIIVIPEGNRIKELNDYFCYANIDLSIDRKILLEYGSDTIVLINTIEEDVLRKEQRLISGQSHVTKLAISEDNKEIVTYDCTEKSLVLWKYGKCSIDR